MKTTTRTKTLTRYGALVNQVEYAFLKLTDHGRDQFETVVEPGLEAGVIRSILFFTEPIDGGSAPQLRLTIDWVAHNRAAGATARFVPPHCWEGEVSYTLWDAVQNYRELTRWSRLKVNVTVSVAPGAFDLVPELSNLPRRNIPKRNSDRWETRKTDGLGELTVEMCGHLPEDCGAVETAAAIETQK